MFSNQTFRKELVLTCAIAGLWAGLFAHVPPASAIPSYARQTGFPCKSCHYMPPELTPLGRAFKLNGYTMTGKPTITSPGKGNDGGLNILESFPLSVLFDTSVTSLKTPQPVPQPGGAPAPSQNGSFEFPQQASLFLAGAWATHLGSFVQVTYTSQGDHFTWDNSDIRYANATKLFGKDLAFGLDLNNNPTLEDLWNSTPAWGFPWVGSDWAPGPTAGALINGGLAQDVAGAGAYGMWDNHVYFDATAYRSAHIGASLPNTGAGAAINVRGVAPYWRLALQEDKGNNNLMVGTYGMYVTTTPFGVTGLEDVYTDWGVDFQYDRVIPQFHNDVLSLRGTYIRENSSLNSSISVGSASSGAHHLNTFQTNAEYHFGDKYAATIGWFNLTGTSDPLLYPAGTPVSGNFNGDPRSSGYIANFSWWPVQNIGLTFQYTGYTSFNGARANYDGFGRNAYANDTFYLLARFVF